LATDQTLVGPAQFLVEPARPDHRPEKLMKNDDDRGCQDGVSHTLFSIRGYDRARKP
jgi:hypothetical protein